MVDVSDSPSSSPPIEDVGYMENLIPEDNVERLRNIRDMFENSNNDSDELVLQKVEKLQPSEKIKDRFKNDNTVTEIYSTNEFKDLKKSELLDNLSLKQQNKIDIDYFNREVVQDSEIEEYLGENQNKITYSFAREDLQQLDFKTVLLTQSYFERMDNSNFILHESPSSPKNLNIDEPSILKSNIINTTSVNNFSSSSSSVTSTASSSIEHNNVNKCTSNDLLTDLNKIDQSESFLFESKFSQKNSNECNFIHEVNNEISKSYFNNLHNNHLCVEANRGDVFNNEKNKMSTKDEFMLKTNRNGFGFENGVTENMEDEYQSDENSNDDGEDINGGNEKKHLKLKKKKDIIAFAEMNNVKTKFENIASEISINGNEPRPIRCITPPREGADRVEIENQPMERPANIVSVFEKIEDQLPETGYIRSRKEIFSSSSPEDLNSSKQPPRIKSITPPREDIIKRVLKEKTPERNDNVIRESDRNEDFMPSAGTAKQTAAIFANGSSRLKSIERSGITIEGELAEKGIAKSRLALFNDPNAVQKSSTISTTELESEIIKNASGIAKERLNLFKNLEQQPGLQSSPSREFKKLKEFTPPPQLDNQQRQYIIIDKDATSTDSNQNDISKDSELKEYMPESGLAKSRIKQYMESASTTGNQSQTYASNATNSNGEVEDLPGKGLAKSLLAKWKSMESVKDKETSPEPANGSSKNRNRATSKDRQSSTNSNDSSNDDQLPQSGTAKSLVNKWQNIDNSSSSNKERKAPRTITPPPPEELERQKNITGDENDSENKPYSDEELAKIGKGHAKNALAKFEQSLIESNNRVRKTVTPPKEFLKIANSNSVKTVFESNPIESNLNAQFAEEDVIPSAGHAKQLKSKFLSLEKEANKVETSSSKMNYVPKKFTSNTVPSTNKPNLTNNKPKLNNTQNGDSSYGSQPLSVDKCCVCEKTVYAMEKIEADKKVYHKFCFKCTSCNCTLNDNSFVIISNMPYCLQDSSKLRSNLPNTPDSPSKYQKSKDSLVNNKKASNLDAQTSIKIDQQLSPKHEQSKSPKHESTKSPKHELTKSPKHEPIKSPKHEVKPAKLEPKSPIKSK